MLDARYRQNVSLERKFSVDFEFTYYKMRYLSFPENFRELRERRIQNPVKQLR